MSAWHELQFQTLLITVAVVGAVLFAWAFGVLKRKLLFQSIPRSAIRSLAMGLCEVSGQATTESPLKAPISGAPCVYYYLEIFRNSHPGSRETLEDGARYVPFALDDGTGKVLVNPRGAEFVGLPTFRFYGFSYKMPDSCRAYFAQKHFSLGFSLDTFLIKERVCPVGPLFVLGAAAPPEDGGPDRYRAVFASDRAAPVFLISAESQKDYLAGLSGSVWLGLVGGPLLTLVCLVLAFLLF